MKLEKIKSYQKQFLDHIAKHGLRGREYMYEAQSNWQSHWDIESLDLTTVYDKSLTSTISGRLWSGSQNSAKESMIEMLSVQKEYVRSAFRDLFSVEKDLGLRCDRFMFYCDEAIKSVTKSNILEHKHDRSIMCLYLTFNFPDEYALYDYTVFRGMMERLESRNIPTEIELERYQKSMRAIHTVMSKNEDWQDLLRSAIGRYYIPGSLLVMNDFAHYVYWTSK